MHCTINLLIPCIRGSCIEIKIYLNFYFHTSLWFLRRFYEDITIGKRRVKDNLMSFYDFHLQLPLTLFTKRSQHRCSTERYVRLWLATQLKFYLIKKNFLAFLRTAFFKITFVFLILTSLVRSKTLIAARRFIFLKYNCVYLRCIKTIEIVAQFFVVNVFSLKFEQGKSQKNNKKCF